jgi:hypothetical protein
VFVTTAPGLFGRFPNDQRKSLVEGADVGGTQLELLSARRHGSHLFLRYSVLRPPTSRRSSSSAGLSSSPPSSPLASPPSSPVASSPVASSPVASSPLGSSSSPPLSGPASKPRGE